jgi:hypothetical protein
MLRINRLRIEISTANGVYGIDTPFSSGLNFIASEDNTCGKSSILAAIYYCLGLEQIIGGVGGIGSKVLTSAFKSAIEDQQNSYKVLESGAYLEISNGHDTVTIYRNITSESKDNRLVSVYYSDYNAIGDPKTQVSDFYVNIQNAATSEKGFHTFLEEFLHISLPMVGTSDGNERKLYLQIVFSAIFIEQKHGWSDILSGMPVFGIRESKKRVIEFLLDLDTIKNERERARLRNIKTQIENDWEKRVETFQYRTLSHGGTVINLPLHPRVLSDNDYLRITILTDSDESIADAIIKLQEQYDAICLLKPRVIDNFEELNRELSETLQTIRSLEDEETHITEELFYESSTIQRLEKNIALIDTDIQNNNDAARLQNFGSDNSTDDCSSICPVCKQKIYDNMLLTKSDFVFMDIETNILHLKEQKKMLVFALSNHRARKEQLEQEKSHLATDILALRRLAQALRSDLYMTTDTDSSEAIMLKKIEISRKIESFKKLQEELGQFLLELRGLSEQWDLYLKDKAKLPKHDKSDSDVEKIHLLKTQFIKNLKLYHYSSLSDFGAIDISEESLLPTIDGFDMKFDSSASDGIRVIWAFTMALLQVSLEKSGNHPGIIIFDEPAQQSIVPQDMDSFIKSTALLRANSQVIMAITLNSHELIQIIDNLEQDTYQKTSIVGKAFQLLQ